MLGTVKVDETEACLPQPKTGCDSCERPQEPVAEACPPVGSVKKKKKKKRRQSEWRRKGVQGD